MGTINRKGMSTINASAQAQLKNEYTEYSNSLADYKIKTDSSRDELFTDFSKAIMEDRYLYEGESMQDSFARIAKYYADDIPHAERLYDYLSKHWFMAATPILSNGGTKRGLPISCFLNRVNDNLSDIFGKWSLNGVLASLGGGLGTYWGGVRSIGERVKRNGKSSGIIPFIGVQDRLTLAVSQGSLRRGSAAVYLPIWHPEIEEFIEIRRPTGGDPNRKSLNIHHGVVITNDFMHAVKKDAEWNLTSPHDGSVIRTVKARELWIRLLLARVETGEPYLLFIDNVKAHLPESYKKLGLDVETSNLCSEITLATGNDHHGQERTAVCCLSSLNLEKFDEWENNPMFITDVMRFLDNVLQDFIDKAPSTVESAKYSAMRERSVGLGVMGFHSFLQSKMIPFESALSKAWNKKIFKHVKEQADAASVIIAEEKGSCPDAEEAGIKSRFTHKIAIAPTASISIIAGNTSPGIEPYNANSYTQKTLTGSFNVKNKHLIELLKQKGKNSPEVWSSIMTHEGSVQHLDFLTQDEKDIFKTAFEIDQRWVIDLAADRTPYICQAQSLNVFIPSDIHKKELHELHYRAWKKGVKSMYYCRSKSIMRADAVSKKVVHPKQLEMNLFNGAPKSENNDNKYDECLACQ